MTTHQLWNCFTIHSKCFLILSTTWPILPIDVINTSDWLLNWHFYSHMNTQGFASTRLLWCSCILPCFNQWENKDSMTCSLQQQHAVWLLLELPAPLSLPSQGQCSGLQPGHKKATLTAGRNRESKSTASSCSVPMGLVTDICNCSLNWALTFSVWWTVHFSFHSHTLAQAKKDMLMRHTCACFL